MRPITATDLMNPIVLAARDDMNLVELAAFLMDNEISGAPVKNRRGGLVGVVSVVDVVRAIAELDEENGAEEDNSLKRLESDEWLVSDIMTPLIYSVAEDALVSEVAATMLDNHLHRILVTRDEEPVGIISSSDLLGLLVDEKED